MQWATHNLTVIRPPWNAGRKVGPKRALKQKEVWAIRFWLDQERRLRDRALFDLAIDSKLRGCDLVRVRIDDLVRGNAIRDRATIVQRKTGRPVQFEILEPARSTLLTWLERRGGGLEEFVFPSRMTTRAISARASMAVLLTNGCRRSDSSLRTMARIRCAGLRPR